MNLPRKDLIATGLVVVAGVIYGLWALDAAPPGMSGTRVSGMVVLLLGFVASAGAVVPTFGELLRGNRAYLAMTSLIGLVAFVAGVAMLVSSSGAAFSVMIVAMVVLWLFATTHHVLLTQNTSPRLVDEVRPTPQRRAHPAGTH